MENCAAKKRAETADAIHVWPAWSSSQRGGFPENMINVIPRNDEKAHEHGVTCWCKPMLTTSDHGEVIAVHQATDCRETCERATGESLADDKKWLVLPD